MRLLWSFIFALAKANLTLKYTQGSTDKSFTSLTLDGGLIKADGLDVPADAVYGAESSLGTVEKIIFGRLRMVSSV